MAFSRFCMLCILFTIILAASSASATLSDGMGFVMPDLRSGCRGSVEECLAGEEEEFELDSESSRRILATQKYISYGALQKNNVPCSRRGASYYNCRPGAQANPYSRGCSAITRCRR